jgi:hypothetical protein
MADPKYGGTYLTLMATLANFSGKWPGLFLYSAIDYLTLDGIPGYFVLSGILVPFGWIMFPIYKKHFTALSKLQKEDWTITIEGKGDDPAAKPTKKETKQE